MDDEDDLVSVAVSATLGRLAAQGDAEKELNRRRLAVWRMHNEQGRSVSDIADSIRDILREQLAARGLTPDEVRDVIQDAGVGYHSIAKIVKAPKPVLGHEKTGPAT